MLALLGLSRVFFEGVACCANVCLRAWGGGGRASQEFRDKLIEIFIFIYVFPLFISAFLFFIFYFSSSTNKGIASEAGGGGGGKG
jgi:hypothetical protein